MNLPPVFVRNIQNAFGDRGRQWLVDLPALIDHAREYWDLTNIRAVDALSYNYVAFANRGKGEVVLKIGVPNRELVSEMHALKHFNGDGCVRLLEDDPEHSMFLLERLRPGQMLTTIEDDDQATHIACDLMLHLWRPAPEGVPFIKLSEWFGELEKVRPMFGGGTGPFPESLFARVEALLPELFATTGPFVLMHGDFHHYNVLSCPAGWLVIDPKGVIGPAGYEVGPLLTNPFESFMQMGDPVRTSERRIAILSERLGFSRELIRDWGLCHDILSGFWDMQEDGSGADYAIACAEAIAQAKV